ncbi:MAG: hypothetical protein ACREXY_13110 [Gammaproteobacteria bacterium]
MTDAQRKRLAELKRTEDVVCVIETHLPPARVIVYTDDRGIGENEAQIHADGSTYWADSPPWP